MTDWRAAVWTWLTRIVLGVVALAVAGGVLWFSWTYAGPVATIVYVVMFGMGLALLPGAVFVLRDMMPSFVGRLLFALGQLGFGGSWLVQTGDGWEICARRESDDGDEQYYHAGEWHTVVDDAHTTRLGWAQFGITWHKTPEQLGRYRVDDQAVDSYDDLQPTPDAPDIEDIATMSPEEAIQANSGVATDGGTASMTAPAPEELLSKSGVWVVDYREYWQDRMQGIGETGLLDDVERVTQRDEALAQTVNQNRLMIGSAFGLLMGAATAYVAMVGF